MVTHAETEHGQHNDTQTQSNSLCHLALINHLTCKKARGYQPDGIHSKKQTAADSQAHLLGIEGDIIGNLTIREGQQSERNTRQQAFYQNKTVQRDRWALDRRSYFGLNP